MKSKWNPFHFESTYRIGKKSPTNQNVYTVENVAGPFGCGRRDNGKDDMMEQKAELDLWKSLEGRE